MGFIALSNRMSKGSFKWDTSEFSMLSCTVQSQLHYPSRSMLRAVDAALSSDLNHFFHCFTVHFDSLRFIHTNSCSFSYNYVSVF